MTRRRKIGSWIVGVLLTPVVLLALLVGALYLPPVQQWAVEKACEFASEQTGMDIRLERIRIRFPLDIDLQGLSATTPPDTILAVQHVIVDLNLSDIFQGRIGVDALDIEKGTIDTRDLIATVIVKGEIGCLHINAHPVLLKEQRAMLTGVRLDDCDVDIALRDTTVIDTTETAPILWSIDLGNIEARKTHVAFHTVGDSICVQGSVEQLAIKGGDIDLGQGIYKVDYVLLDADSVEYNDMVLHGIGLEAKHLLVDDTHIQAPSLHLGTQYSHIDGRVNLEWSALTPKERGKMDIDIDASLGQTDILAIGNIFLTPEQATIIPEAPITLTAKAYGNVDSICIDLLRLTASPMAEAVLQGNITSVMDAEHLGADLQLEARTYDLKTVRRLMGLDNSIHLPQMHLTGDAHLHNQQYTADLQLQQGTGRAWLKGQYNALSEAYKAKLDIRNLNLHNFLPKDSLYHLTAKADISGVGTDVLSRRAQAKADIDVKHLEYGKNNIDSIRLNGQIRHGEGQVNLYSNNHVLQADACVNIKSGEWRVESGEWKEKSGEWRVESGERKEIDFSLSVTHIDLYALGISNHPLKASMVFEADGSSNLKDTHEAKGYIRTVELMPGDTIFYPTDVEFSLLMSPDTLYIQATSGDLALELISHDGLDRFFEKTGQLTTELERQLAAHTIAQDTLKSLLPQLTLNVRSGNKNTMAHIVKSMGYTYDHLSLSLNCDTLVGINGNGQLHALNTGAILLDTIQWNIYQDTTNVVRLGGRVRNGPRNKQVVFESKMSAELTPSGAAAAISFYDAKGYKGMDFGAQLSLKEDGYRLHLYPLKPVIAYRNFTLNEDNFIYLHDDNRIEANIELLADDGTGFKLYSTPNDDALQDLTLSVHDFNLGELSSVIPYMPKIGGMLAGDFHLVQDEQSMSVLVDANVQEMAFEEAKLGNIGLNAVYLPNADGTHYVDGIVSHEGNEVMLLAGTYDPKDEGTIDAKGTLQRLPLTLVNGFIPNQVIALAGYVTGEMDVTGKVTSPTLDGAIATDSMFLNSDMYSLHLRFPDDTIGVRKGNLNFNRIEAYSTGKSPLVLDGTIDLQDLDRIGLDLSLSAQNFELINAPKSQKAIAYGKVYVNIGSRLTGTLNDIVLKGKLDVLGNTAVTYGLTDSPLTVKDQLSELVTFVDFSDTLAVNDTEKVAPQNIDMTLNIGIEQAAQVHCLLSADGKNYIDLEGGGELTMTYSTQDGAKLFGRYTIISGMMNYSLMVIALKNLTIANGSYVEFTGNIMNPRLNISANERVKTTVYENNVPHSVTFEVGLNVTQTLENMGLEFTLEAPSDLTIYNQLATMSAEERGKVAVTMLATGMYLTESGNGTSGFSATNALNSFLQSQIAAISSKALSTIDVNFGIDNTSTASGGTQTDYNFSFSKRFWGNRISLIIGGKVSSGSEVQNTGASIINNISVEYRLDKSATRYVRLYYDHDTESLLEGDILEMGAGIVFRKKSTRLGELFLFKKK